MRQAPARRWRRKAASCASAAPSLAPKVSSRKRPASLPRLDAMRLQRPGDALEALALGLDEAGKAMLGGRFVMAQIGALVAEKTVEARWRQPSRDIAQPPALSR